MLSLCFVVLHKSYIYHGVFYDKLKLQSTMHVCSKEHTELCCCQLMRFQAPLYNRIPPAIPIRPEQCQPSHTCLSHLNFLIPASPTCLSNSNLLIPASPTPTFSYLPLSPTFPTPTSSYLPLQLQLLIPASPTLIYSYLPLQPASPTLAKQSQSSWIPSSGISSVNQNQGP
jgi:hypothetical protein